jgi:hypothetical protein
LGTEVAAKSFLEELAAGGAEVDGLGSEGCGEDVCWLCLTVDIEAFYDV